MKYHTFESESALRTALYELVGLSCWFEVTPEPDDQWTVTVKDDVPFQRPTTNTFVTPDGTRLVAKPKEDCRGCVFHRTGVVGRQAHGTQCSAAPPCDFTNRDDDRSIIWVKA